MDSNLKRVLNVIIGIFLFISIFCFTICCLTRTVIKKDFINNIVKNELLNSASLNDGGLDVKKLVEDDDIDEVISGLIDDSIVSVETGKYEVSDETFNDLKKYLKENSDVFAEISDESVDIESIIDSDEFDEVKNEINKSFKELNNLGAKEKKAIKTFAKITSAALITLLALAIVVFIILLIIINKSVFIPMLVTGIDLIISGIFTSSIYVIAVLLIKAVANSANTKISLSPTSIIVAGLVELIMGILLVVVQSVCKKKSNKKEEKEKTPKTKKKSSKKKQ